MIRLHILFYIAVTSYFIRGHFYYLRKMNSQGDESKLKDEEKEKYDKQEKFNVILKALEGLDFGELQITIHEGKVVQVNRIEKQRFSV